MTPGSDQIRSSCIYPRVCVAVTTSACPFSCGGLQGGAGLWRQAGIERRPGASAEAAENLPEEGLLQDPRRQQVSGDIASALGPAVGGSSLPQAHLSESTNQECQQAGDHQGLQEAGAAVAPGQLPVRGGEKGGGEEVYWHRLSQRGPDRPRSASLSYLCLLMCCGASASRRFSFQKWDRSSMLARIRWTRRTSREGEDGSSRGLSTLTPSSLAEASTSNSSTTKTRGRPCPHTHTHTPGGRWGGGEHPPGLPPSRFDSDLVWPTTWRWREVKDDNGERICVVAEGREALLRDGNSRLQKLNSWDLNFLLICLFHSFGRGTFLSVAQDCKEFFFKLLHYVSRWSNPIVIFFLWRGESNSDESSSFQHRGCFSAMTFFFLFFWSIPDKWLFQSLPLKPCTFFLHPWKTSPCSPLQKNVTVLFFPYKPTVSSVFLSTPHLQPRKTW